VDKGSILLLTFRVAYLNGPCKVSWRLKITTYSPALIFLIIKNNPLNTIERGGHVGCGTRACVNNFPSPYLFFLILQPLSKHPIGLEPIILCFEGKRYTNSAKDVNSAPTIVEWFHRATCTFLLFFFFKSKRCGWREGLK
jgi:hypothetical protein